MKKLTLFLVIVSALVANTFAVSFIKNISEDSPVDGVVERLVGSRNDPDRCVEFTQIASRSVKDRVKIYPGKVYGFTVTSSHSEAVFFQIYDQVNLPLNGLGYATPSFTMPIPAETAVEGLARVDYTFPNPLDITASGIMFALSEEMTYYSSATLQYKDFFVNICYY